jgi:F0F1-type ATP synthase membrane subunit a
MMLFDTLGITAKVLSAVATIGLFILTANLFGIFPALIRRRQHQHERSHGAGRLLMTSRGRLTHGINTSSSFWTRLVADPADAAH